MNINFSDENILKTELKKGNHQALVFLIDTYHHKLCAYAFSLSNDYDTSQDIVQNVFVSIWEKRTNIYSVKSIKGFLNKSVYNGFIDQWRKDKRIVIIEKKHLEALDSVVENFDEDQLKRQMDMVNCEIQKLAPKCKETFLLSKKDGLTNIEIAEYMNVSVRTVESQMNKAFNALRKKLKNKMKPILFLMFGFSSSAKDSYYTK